MIVLDTTVLVYAVGADHPLAEECRRLVRAIAEGRIVATTTAEVIQEFVHVRARRRDRRDATALGRSYARALSPLVTVREEDLDAGLQLYRSNQRLGAFDCVLAATASAAGAEALVSADAGFASVRALRHVAPGSEAFARMLDSDGD